MKIFHFNCLKSKWAISCQMFNSKWQTTSKLRESWKNIGGKSTHFCLEPKLELDAVTLVLHFDFCSTFYKYFWFWYQTEIVSKKVYAVICPVLEITSLKSKTSLLYGLELQWRKMTILIRFYKRQANSYRCSFFWPPSVSEQLSYKTKSSWLFCLMDPGATN